MITWLNMGVRTIAPRAALSQRDLLVIYSMLAVGSAFSGHDSMPRLMGVMSYAYRFATPENDWEALLFRHLPPWLVIADAGLVKDLYEGEVSFLAGGYWRHWAVPILSWSVVILLLIAMFFCLTVMIRRQWVENEKLAYPIIRIPLEVSAGSGVIFRNRLLWIGFAIAAGINVLNGLEYFFPALPSMPVKKYDLNVHFTQKPWNAMGSMPLRFHPYLIGLAFILPLDLSFSCVFFYFVAKAQMLMGSMVGVATLPGYPFLGEQGAGALFALLTVACWTGRKHLLKVLSSIVHSSREDDAGEPISYRTAVVTFGICIALLMVICVKGGMTIWGYALFITIYLLIVVGVTRMRAELGPPIHAIGYATPQYLMIAMIGTQRLRPRQLDDAVPDELAQRSQLRVIPNSSNARSARGLQTGRTNRHTQPGNVRRLGNCQRCRRGIHLNSFSLCCLRRRNRLRLRADSLRRIGSIQLPLRMAGQSQIYRLVWDVNSRANIFRKFGYHVSPHPICLVSIAPGRIRHRRCPRHPNHQCTLAATGNRNDRQVANTQARRSQSLSARDSLLCWLSPRRGPPRLLLANNQSCPAHLGLQLLLSQQKITTPTAYSCLFSRDDALCLTRGCLASRTGHKVKMSTVHRHPGICMFLRSCFYLTRTLKYETIPVISLTSQHRRSLLAPVFIDQIYGLHKQSPEWGFYT